MPVSSGDDVWLKEGETVEGERARGREVDKVTRELLGGKKLSDEEIAKRTGTPVEVARSVNKSIQKLRVYEI